MDQETWDHLSECERSRRRDLSALTPALVGLEGWRVELTYAFPSGQQETARGIVSRSTGWLPIHILLKRRDSRGGFGVLSCVSHVRKLYRVR